MSKPGLALGGGGARGLAHIGVLRVLEKEGIQPRAIAGCSIGSLIGGLYAYYGNSVKVEEFILEAIKNPVFRVLGFDKLEGYNKNNAKNYFEQFLDYVGERIKAIMALERIAYFEGVQAEEVFNILPDVLIEKFRIKYSAVATDLLSGIEINITKGSLREAIRASSTIPGIFPPVKLDGHLLIDGSATDTIPAGKVRNLGADRVIAVDVSHDLKTSANPRNVYDVMFRTEAITSYHLSRLRLKEADLVIVPEVRHLSWTDFSRSEEIIKAGEDAAYRHLDDIKKLMKSGSVSLRVKRYMKRINGD